jgi:peptidoglycan/xylan/chitin deacetylase (PgdA/CDA1 family)
MATITHSPATTSAESTALPAIQVDGPTKIAYLTFDDGPDPVYTPQVLDVLRHFGVPATFFVIGSRVEQHPEIVRAAVAAGHAIGNHTFTHPKLGESTKAVFDEEISATDQAMRAALAGRGAPTAIMRPPYGSIDEHTEDYARSSGLRMVLWDVDPHDWSEPGAAHISRIVLANIQPGSVILMHDGGGDRSGTVSALATIVPALLEEGYTFGTIAAD